jgi:hypothetical protein
MCPNKLEFVTVSHLHSSLVFAGKARACKGAPLEPSLSGLRVKCLTTGAQPSQVSFLVLAFEFSSPFLSCVYRLDFKTFHGAAPFCRCAVLSTCHFVNLPFCQISLV